MTDKSIIILSLVVFHSSFINGKTCRRQLVEEWHPQPSSYVVNWTLTENICMDFYRDCWVLGVNTKIDTSEINLMNVSETSFIDCVQNTTTEDQLLFGCRLKGMHTVNSKWLSVGTHYFVTVMASGPSLCSLGTSTKCDSETAVLSEICSGHGKCLSEVWSKIYSCHCQPPFSGKYCQEHDAYSSKPCKNNGSCINERGKWDKQGYECVCHPPFTGNNCSEIIGQCQPHICFHGNCSNITSNSFICECDEQYSGPFCEVSTKPCVSLLCWKRGICPNSSSAYTCECPKGSPSQNDETDVNECLLIPCQNGTDCIKVSNDVMCICSPIFTDMLCKSIQTSYESFPLKNTTICKKCEKEYHCSCMPGFTGKNCEKVIDHCRLLSINCLNEEWCFNIIGRFRHVLIAGCRINPCSFVKNVYLIHQHPCYYGVTCHGICQDKGPAQFEYVWQLGFTGSEDEKCQGVIDAYFFLAANCTEDAIYVNKPEDINNSCWFPCEGTKEICANGCSCLRKEDSQEYQCLCFIRWADNMYLENTTDDQGNECQHEAICKDEINRPRYLFQQHMERFI
uniref:EGF-like domain-containing protein n=1 Tax=Aotus nancymaae TaxID=37293 RepID=A0A2K5BVI6_AOTNA